MLVPAAVTLALGCVGLVRVELWRDELATWNAATRPVADLFAMAGNIDAFYFPYYLFTHFWIGIFGDSAAALRAPSVLAAAGATALVALIGSRWFGRPAGFCAGTVFALIPMVSRMAQEARPYAFAMLFVALSTWLLLRAVDDPAWGRWAGYGAGMTALGASQVTALTLVAGHAALVFVRWRRHRDNRVLRFAVAFAAALVPLAPLAVTSLGQPQVVTDLLPRPDLATLLGFTYPFPPDSAVWPQTFRSAWVAWIVLGLAVLAVVVAKRRQEAALALGMFVLPLVVLWVASQAGKSFYFPRYFVFLLPVAAVAAGITLAAARRPAVWATALAAVAAAGFADQAAARSPDSHDHAFYPYPNMFSEYPGQHAAYTQLAERIRTGFRPGDAIVYPDRPNFWFTDTAIAYYLRGEPAPRDVFLAKSAVDNASLFASDTTDYADRLRGTNRVWVVGLGERRDWFAANPRLFAPPPSPAKVAAVTGDFETAEVSRVPGFTLTLMTRRP
ncbi:glycosyltransferase family 39 protein [Actinokineospora iranica]|uniref:Mannosyltransferase n=1 Tax=Actinokineospora iranica TaxID=1271860 RepID=A0A1G6K9U5_9PSEU|nr:glycosyltransferase family 39 protein [Actinokineospora iranica]SDC27822.1 mannosyltransferase [Actinokineospora iranica]